MAEECVSARTIGDRQIPMTRHEVDLLFIEVIPVGDDDVLQIGH